jgi:glucose/arabinose dehydrogenase
VKIPRVGAAFALACALWTSASAQLTSYTWVSGFTAPIQMVQSPDDYFVRFVVQQGGQIRVIRNGAIEPTPFLDISSIITSGGERGLLGLEFAPDYATSGYFYVNYTDLSGNTQIARYTRSANPLVADPNSRYPILSIAQPFSNHNAGTLRFGPDGYLYIGMGDGGSANDPGNRAQSPTVLLGKMLRIDVNRDDFPADPAKNYGIPPDNPFLGGVPIAASPEIWAFGFRNPYRWSFDRASLGGTNAIVIGDVGQNSWEEVDYEPANRGGRNYGWRTMEGFHNTGLGPPAYTPLTNPIHEYSTAGGGAITGGYIYRGSMSAPHYGRYFFADYIQRRVWSLGLSIDQNGEATANGLTEHTSELGGSAAIGNIASIDIDQEGELYLVARDGFIRRIIPTGPVSSLPISAFVQNGLYVSGGYQQLRQSNDQYMIAQRWRSPAEGQPIAVVIEGASARPTASQISISVEAKANYAGTWQQIQAWNFATNSWTLLDTQADTPTTDTVRTVTITSNANNYIEAGSGRLRIRVGWGENTPFLPRWSGFIDQVKWTITP